MINPFPSLELPIDKARRGDAETSCGGEAQEILRDYSPLRAPARCPAVDSAVCPQTLAAASQAMAAAIFQGATCVWLSWFNLWSEACSL